MHSHIESILLVASRPLRYSDIAQALDADTSVVAEVIEELKARYNTESSGIHIFVVDDTVRIGTNPAHAAVVEQFMKDEIAGELPKAQLETLTVIAYRGPITRAEIEQIRGVNCSVILRNLLVRGLIEERQDEASFMPVYTLSFDALRHLGLTSISELPEYDTLRTHAHIDAVLAVEEPTDDDAHAA